MKKRTRTPKVPFKSAAEAADWWTEMAAEIAERLRELRATRERERAQIAALLRALERHASRDAIYCLWEEECVKAGIPTDMVP